MDYSYQPIDYKEEEDLKKEDKYFYGYRRKNGLAGIRNEIWIIPTVGCVKMIAKVLENRSREFVGEAVEGIFAFPHHMDVPSWAMIS